MPINLPLPPGARSIPLQDQVRFGSQKPIADIDPSGFMSPLEPVSVMTPPGTRIRQRPTLQGENLVWQPKGNDPFGYWILREFADTCELMRAVIDTVEDKICSSPWEIRLVRKTGEKKGDYNKRSLKDNRIAKVTQLLQKPDGFWTFSLWLRQLVEDMIVLDAGAIWKERDVKGRIANFRVIDGATINRCITEQGFVPPPPSVAYQQVLYGLVWWEGTTNDIKYVMHNPRTHKRYGYSVVEQCLVHLNIAIRQQDFTQKYFTDGNIPEALCFLPSDLPIDRVKEIQGYIDSILAGNNAKRRRLTFLPGYGRSDQQSRPNVIFPKEVLLKDPLMDWLFQLFCYKLGTSPQAMLRMMNRATAQQSAENAEEEGEVPKKAEIVEVMNDVIQSENGLGFSDLEFAWSSKRETDGLKQAQIDDIYAGKVITLNEIREDLGRDPRPEAEANMLGEFTPNGFVPLDADAQAERITQLGQARAAANPQPDQEDESPSPKGKKQPAGKQPQKKKAWGRHSALGLSRAY